MPDPDLQSFLQYFQRHYAGRPELWALFHRKGFCLSTNNHLESMRSTLKNSYMGRVQNQRLDRLIRILFEMTHDKPFSRMIALVKGRTGHHFTDIGNKHWAGLELVDNGIEKKAANMWLVTSQSSQGEQYIVTRIDSNCHDCRLRCRNCNACAHHYVCTCMDFALHLHMCKHVHGVAYTGVQASKINKESEDCNLRAPPQRGEGMITLQL